jgi:excisionase family DNA binding protein
MDDTGPMDRGTKVRRRVHGAAEQDTLPMELGVPMESEALERRRRGGRRPITETREEIIRRLLDPELSIHEAAAVLNLSKATVRRYTDQGKLGCARTQGGQRRFRLSVLLAFLEAQAVTRGEA